MRYSHNARTAAQSSGYVAQALAAFFAGQPRVTDHAMTPKAVQAPARTMQFVAPSTRRETRDEQLTYANGAGSNIFPVDMDFVLGRNGKGQG